MAPAQGDRTVVSQPVNTVVSRPVDRGVAMQKLSTTVAVYPDIPSAEDDWSAVESAAEADQIHLADAALVRRNADGTVERLEREAHHGWGKGAVAGAVVGLLFPASIVGGAVVGGLGGG